MTIWVFSWGSDFKSETLATYAEAAQTLALDLEWHDPAELCWDLHDPASPIFCAGKELQLPMAVLVRIGSSVTPRLLALLDRLEKLGVYVCNSPASLRLTTDRALSAQTLAHHHLPQPPAVFIGSAADLAFAETQLQFPVVVKLSGSSQGAAVTLCHTPHDLSDLLSLAQRLSPAATLFAQQFLAVSAGRDVRVVVVGGCAVGAMQRQQGAHFKANISLGGHGAEFPFDKTLAKTAETAAAALGLEIAGVDFLFDESGRPAQICEVNASPGYRGFLKATGILLPPLFLQLLRDRVAARVA